MLVELMEYDVDNSHIKDGQIRGVLLTSYTAIRPLDNLSPSLKETASRSPEASQAIFSIP